MRDLEGYRRLHASSRVPIAAGEPLDSKTAFKILLEEELVDYARIDLCNVGGLTEAVKVAAICEAHDIRVAVHNPLGAVSTAACLQFNLALSSFGVQEQPFQPGTDQEIFPCRGSSYGLASWSRPAHQGSVWSSTAKQRQNGDSKAT